MPLPNNIERRNYTIESITFEEREDNRKHLVGHAAVFDGEFDTGYFVERVASGAFSKSLKKDDVRALWNHDPNYVLGRNKAKTLTLREDEKGLLVDITPPDTQWARDLVVSIERGDVTQMSFGFEPLDIEWIRGEKNKPDTRILKEVRLWDVSPVTFPAYVDTDIAARSYEAWKQTLPAETPPPPWKTVLYQRKLNTEKRRFI